MTKTIIAALMLATAGCAYNPAIDTAGRSGTFTDARAQEITNDLQHCNKLAADNTFRPLDEAQQITNAYINFVTLGIVPKRKKLYDSRVLQCLKGRGHSVIE